jgi:PAS domain S-box-containing protein
MTDPDSPLAMDEGGQRSRDVLFEQGSDPIAHVTLDDARTIRDVNPRFETIFGCDRESVRGESLFDIVRPDPGVGPPVEATAPGGDGNPVTSEVTRTTADGSRQFVGRLAAGGRRHRIRTSDP